MAEVEQHSGGKVGLADYNGLYRTNPKLALMMTLALFSLAGIPPFAGFFSKFFVFAAAFKGGVHRACQYGGFALLLPVGREGDVHYAQRRADRTAAQRPLYAHQPCALHGRGLAAGCLQRGLRQYQRILVRALAGREWVRRGHLL